MSDPIDRIVKGAPPPNISPSQLAASAKSTSLAHSSSSSITAPVPPPQTSQSTTDPLSALPSSPPQIYLNLLILESSLRLQYVSLRTRLRLYSFALVLILLWLLTFTYLLFFRPREDGSGVGGSVYWVIESIEKLGWCSGIVTLCLFWGTGMYERGVRWPRRWVGTANRGLRGVNLKVVVVRGSFLSEIAGWLFWAFLSPLWLMRGEKRVNFQFVPRDVESSPTHHSTHQQSHSHGSGLVEEDIAPSGDVIRLLLLPKPFSPDFREGWDTYRQEYWERENARRAQLRLLVRQRERELAKKEGGWLWWTGWRGWANVSILGGGRSRRQRERMAMERLAGEKTHAKRARDRLRDADGSSRPSSSRGSSRSSTPGPADESLLPSSRRSSNAGAGEHRRHRRTSSSASTTLASGPRRPRKATANEKSRLSATETLLQDRSGGSRNGSWDATAPLTRMSEVPTKKEAEEKADAPDVKAEPVFVDVVGIKSEPEEM